VRRAGCRRRLRLNRAAILGDEFDFSRVQPRVCRDRAQPRGPAPEQELEELAAIFGDHRFDSRLLQEETVKRTSNYVDVTRRAGTLLLLEERRSTWGPRGDKAVASGPIGEVDRANQNRLAPSRQCGSSIPSGGSAFETFCQVKYFSPRSWQLTFTSGFAEFARDFSVRIAADWPSALLPIVHIFRFVQCPQNNPNTGPSSRFRA
jgi:hypothetical protein